MENLNQIHILYINLALLMFTSSLALYLPKKMGQGNKKENLNFHPEINKFYQSLNQSLKIGQPILTYVVDSMPINYFVPFYKGLQDIHGFKVDLKSKALSNGRIQEYIVLDLQSYTGPRSVDVVLYQEKGEKTTQLNNESTQIKQNQTGNVVSIFSRRKINSVINTYENNVVDLNSYRKNRAISYYSPDDNEGA